MSRIIGFVGTSAGVGATTICFELSKMLSKQEYRVCVVDFYFSMNDLSLKFNNETKFDLKDYLIGKIGIDGIVERFNNNLYYIRTNASKFFYIKYFDDIKDLIKKLSLEFDYIIIDVNSFDDRILSLALDVISEAYIIFNNEINSIRMANRYLKYIKKNRNIKNINLLFNKSKIIGQINKKYLSRKDIEELLNENIIFEIPKFLKNNNFCLENRTKYIEKIMNKFCNSFITNRTLHLQYSKNYKGIIGRLKKKYYERFE